MRVSSIRLRWFIALYTGLGLVAGHISAAESDPDGRLFEASPDPVADVEQALERAGDGDRKALVVLGANWCHDSRALAARLHRSPLAEEIEQHYELVFVDVGFLDKGDDVLEQFDVAQFYATPTVLIIDPSTGRLVNDEDRHVWGDAYSIDMATSVEYFEKWAEYEAPADAAAAPEELLALYAQIDQFEQRQAMRVSGGYAVVGPMLEAYKAGDAPDNFQSSWDELRDFRTAIPGDVRELRAEAERRVAAGDEDIQLEFPEYPLLSWETE